MADRSAFEAFYRANLGRVVRACRLVTLDRVEAEDVAAEAFARLWSRWGAIRNDDHAGGFVFKTAMRLCAKENTRRRRPAPRGPVVSGADDVMRALDRVCRRGAPLRLLRAARLLRHLGPKAPIPAVEVPTY